MKSIIQVFISNLFIWSVFFITPNIYAFQYQQVPETIKIGLLISNKNASDAKNGAEIAVKEANKKGGINGIPVELVISSMEGPWGTGSKQAVNLVFNENVWAILGSHNSQNAHLVEQATAKTQTVFLSAWASDPSLSYAYVPWYFSIVPNNNQQANVLIQEIYNKRKLLNLAVVSNTQYDYKLAMQDFVKRVKKSGEKEPNQFVFSESDTNFQTIIENIKRTNADGIVLFTKPSFALNLMQQIQKNNIELPVFGSIFLLGEDKAIHFDVSKYRNINLLSSGNWIEANETPFKKEFQKKYQKKPSAVAAYAYDGMKILIEAIKISKLEREKLQESISKIIYEGVTGTIQFDKHGKRINAVKLVELN